MKNPRGYILLFIFFIIISSYFYLRHDRKLSRHQTKVAAYQELLDNSSERVKTLPYELIRKSSDALVYTFTYKNQSYRSSAPIAHYDRQQSQVIFLEENPKINALNPLKAIDELKSETPGRWRILLSILSGFLAINFLMAFISPVYREKLEYRMYQRRYGQEE